MAIQIEELTIGAAISAWDRGNRHLGDGVVEGYRVDGTIVGVFPPGAGDGDMVNVSLNTGLSHPKITGATLYLTSVTLLPK